MLQHVKIFLKVVQMPL